MSVNITSLLCSVGSLNELEEYFEGEIPMMEYKDIYIVVSFVSGLTDEYCDIYLYSKKCGAKNKTFIKNIAHFEYHGNDFIQDGYDFDEDSEKFNSYIYDYAKRFIDNIK